MKQKLSLVNLILFLIIAGGIFWCYKNNRTTPPPATTQNNYFTYLISAEDPLKYCNGDDMDTVGYAKTITVEKTTATTEENPTTVQMIMAILDVATTGTCHDIMTQTAVTEDNGTIHIPPIDGWAGVSIAMCSCKPQVETNLLRLPGIKEVIW